MLKIKSFEKIEKYYNFEHCSTYKYNNMNYKICFFLIIILVFSCSDNINNAQDYTKTDAIIGSEVGNVIPDFVLTDDEGEDFSFQKYRGYVLLLKFWAPTCGLCVKTMPETIEINEKYYKQNFRAVSISKYVNYVSWKSHLEELDMLSLINLFDDASNTNPLNSIHYFFSIKGIPYYVLIDKYGIIRFKGNAQQTDLIPIIEECLLQ
jgi:thiol-disulfide isomerase/thioredoxin